MPMLTPHPITPQFPDRAKLEDLARSAFPREEYLPPESLMAMAQKGDFDFWGLYEGERFVGYMAVMLFQKIAYLFFLAIAPEERGKGYGRQALGLLTTLYPSYENVVDFEKIDPRKANNEERKRRRTFYCHNGFRATGYFLSYRGVDYEIMSRGPTFDFALFQKLMARIELPDFHPRYFKEDPPPRPA